MRKFYTRETKLQERVEKMKEEQGLRLSSFETKLGITIEISGFERGAVPLLTGLTTALKYVTFCLLY